MLIVKLFNRDERPGNYSIEGVFQNIKSALKEKVIFEEYTLKSRSLRLLSVIGIKKHAKAINHITGDVHFLALGLPSQSTILTVHDIGHYENTLKGIKKIVYKWLWLQWPLAKVKYVTCISEFTKKKLVELVGVAPEKITVIHNPAPIGYKYSPKELNTSHPVILQVGSGHNKNRESLIRAVEGMTCKIIFIGKLSHDHQHLLKELDIAFENVEGVLPEDMHTYYEKADIVYFASTYEGFGLPIIEAQLVGRPVVTSNIASMPEIAGKGALFVNPSSVDEIRTAIRLIIEDYSISNRLVQLGLANCKRFELEKIAEQYFQLYTIVSKN